LKITAKITPTGTCYEDAWRYAKENEFRVLVHGSVLSDDSKRVNHAWVEELFEIWEPQHKTVWKKHDWEQAVKPEEHARYPQERALIMAIRTNNFGPWTSEEQAQTKCNPQKIVDSTKDIADLDKRLMFCLEEQLPNEKANFFETEVTVNLCHGTRRKETLEELKEKGFCTWDLPELEGMMNEAIEEMAKHRYIGPRTGKHIEMYKERGLREGQSSYRPFLYATGMGDNACCSWADRNPEIIWDVLWAHLKPEVTREVLNELFGDPIKVKVKTRVDVRSMFGPQNINTKKKCFKPEEIISIEKCTEEEIKRAYERD